ncbi:DNRLRE domain-containing protein, partial [Gemmatimonadota bacterium]
MSIQSPASYPKNLFLSFCMLVMVLSQTSCTGQRIDILVCDADVTVSETMRKLCSPGGGRQGFMMVGYLELRRSEGDNRAYLRFELNGIDPAGITKAELRLWKSRSREDTLRVFAVEVDGWAEYGTSWGNAPAMGELVASGHCGQGWNTYDVTEYLKKQTDNLVSFGLVVLNQDKDGLGFNSREGGNPPLLAVTHSGPPAGDTPPNPGFPSTSKLKHGVYISDGSSLTSYDDIKSAVAAVKPGQEIVLGPGIYYESFDINTDGTADKPLKIRGDGDPRPIIDGTLNRTAWAKGDHDRGDRGLVRVSGDFWTLEHLEIRNAHPWGESPQQNSASLFILDATGVTVRDCGVYFGSNGIFATATTENLTLEYNEVAYNSFPGRGYKHGHYISGPGITTVRFNHIHHNGGTNFKSRSEHLVFYCN